MNNSAFDYDIVGVGLGPFNLSLAALLEEHRQNAGDETPRALFLEARDRFDWHPGMILPGTTLQVPFFADLVTMAAPTSRFTFLNYLHEHGRLYNFYFYEDFKIYRKEYNRYCQWVSESLESCCFGARVTDVRRETPGDNPNADEGYRVFYSDADGRTHSVTAANIVLGYGTRPTVPACVRENAHPGVFHTAAFAENRERVQRARRAIVVGSGQSAGECVLEILNTAPDVELHWYTRGDGFLPMEYSKLGLEFFSPEYIDYFHGLPQADRDRIRSGQDLYYKGMSSVTIGQIYDALYERSIDPDASRPVLMGGVELTDLRANANAESQDDAFAYQLELRHREEGAVFAEAADVIILGTGYEHALPEFLDNLMPELAVDDQGRLRISRDYRALKSTDRETRNPEGLNGPAKSQVFIQNGEIHTHGIGAPDLGLGAYRASMIANALLGKQHYRIRTKNVFQHFGTRGPAGPNPTSAAESKTDRMLRSES